MQHREIKTFLSLPFFGRTSGCAATQAHGAMLYANDDVALNGQGVGNLTSIFAGDLLDMVTHRAKSINRTGSAVLAVKSMTAQTSLRARVSDFACGYTRLMM